MYIDTSFDVETWMLAAALYAAYRFQRIGDGWLEDAEWEHLVPAEARGWAAVARAVEQLAGGP